MEKRPVFAFCLQLILCVIWQSSATNAPASEVFIQAQNVFNNESDACNGKSPAWSKRRSSPIMRLIRSSSKYQVIKKSASRAVLLGSDLYIPCQMENPIGWLKGDYIIYMDNAIMYDSSSYGSGKFKLNTNPSRTRYSLLIRNIQFSDAGSYFCQTGRGEKSALSVTVVENPSCLPGRTMLREGEMTTFSCVARLKGELSDKTKIIWNKKEQILTKPKRSTSSAGVTMVSSELKYRARFEDNHESVHCYLTSPNWNETSASIPTCSVGILDIVFEPRLICDNLQIFPDVPRAKYYVYCDVVANPIKNLNSISWSISRGGQKKPLEDFENMTRKDIVIPNGYRSRVTVPYHFIKAKGNQVDFLVTMYYGGKTLSKSIKVVVHSPLPSTFVALSIATAIVIFLGIVCLAVLYHLHRRRMGEYDVARRRNDDDDIDRRPTSTHGAPLEEETGGEKDPIYDVVPSLKEPVDEPNNQRPRPEGQTKRKVRFKINI